MFSLLCFLSCCVSTLAFAFLLCLILFPHLLSFRVAFQLLFQLLLVFLFFSMVSVQFFVLHPSSCAYRCEYCSCYRSYYCCCSHYHPDLIKIGVLPAVARTVYDNR